MVIVTEDLESLHGQLGEYLGSGTVSLGAVNVVEDMATAIMIYTEVRGLFLTFQVSFKNIRNNIGPNTVP